MDLKYTPNPPVLHEKDVEFEFPDNQIRKNEPFYVTVNILGHSSWPLWVLGKNSPEERPESVVIPLRNIAEYWIYADQNEADPIQDVDEDWIYND